MTKFLKETVLTLEENKRSDADMERKNNKWKTITIKEMICWIISFNCVEELENVSLDK